MVYGAWKLSVREEINSSGSKSHLTFLATGQAYCKLLEFLGSCLPPLSANCKAVIPEGTGTRMDVALVQCWAEAIKESSQ